MKCRRFQITEAKYNSYMKERGKVPCSQGNEKCSCTYFITDEKVSLEEYVESALKKYNKEVYNSFSDDNKKPMILSEKELVVILQEKHKIARIAQLRTRNIEVKEKDLYLFDQLTPYEKIVWLIFAKLMCDNFVVVDRKNEEKKK